jgi:hypothetical protein
MTNGIAIKQPTLAVELGQRQPQFRAALPAHIPVERFVRVVLTAIQTRPNWRTWIAPPCGTPA